jgi:hypothetical protein
MHSATGSELAQLKIEGKDAAMTPHVSPLDASSYILSRTTELCSLAKAANFPFLTYLLEIVFQEAYRLTSDLERAEAVQRKN